MSNENIKEFETYSDYMATRDEIFIMGWDNIFQVPDIFIFNNIIMKNKEEYNKFLKLELLREFDEFAVQPKLLERSHRNLVEWIKRDNVSDEEAVESYYALRNAREEMYRQSPLTEFATGFDALAMHSYTKKIVIMIPSKDQRIIDRITSILDVDINSKVFFRALEPSEDMYSVITTEYPEFTTMIMDDVNLVEKLMNETDVEHKSFVLPQTGWNFDLVDGVMNAKNKLEFLAVEKNCNLGFMKLMEFEEIHYGVG